MIITGMPLVARFLREHEKTLQRISAFCSTGVFGFFVGVIISLLRAVFWAVIILTPGSGLLIGGLALTSMSSSTSAKVNGRSSSSPRNKVWYSYSSAPAQFLCEWFLRCILAVWKETWPRWAIKTREETYTTAPPAGFYWGKNSTRPESCRKL